MTATTFVAGTPIVKEWLNDVDEVVYGLQDILSATSPTYAATGNGSTNDTAALTAAITAGASGGRPVFLPAGTYMVTTLSLPSGTHLYGDGEKTIIKQIASTTGAVVSSSDTTNGNDNVSIRNLVIDGNKANQTGLANHGINIDGACDNWIITSVTIQETKGHGIQVRGGGVTAATTAATRIRITNSTFTNTGNVEAGTDGREAIYCNQAQTIIISNNHFSGAGRQCIAFEGSAIASYSTRKIIVSNNIIDSPTSGGIDDESGGGEFIVDGNIVFGGGGAAVRIAGAQGNSIVTNNWVYDMAGHGVDVEIPQTTNTNSAIITGNMIRSVDIGIRIVNASHGNVSDNVIETVTGIGLSVTGAGSVGFTINNNLINKPEEEGMVLNRAFTACRVTNNTIIDSGVSGATAPAFSINGTTGTISQIVFTGNIAYETRGTPYMTYGFAFGNIAGGVITGNVMSGTTVTGDVNWITAVNTIQLRDNLWSTARWTNAPTSYFLSEVAPSFSQQLHITDGITAPSAAVGYAKLFVDTADGDLKVIFGDGTTKTIVVDT